jgi:hypothetical protein
MVNEMDSIEWYRLGDFSARHCMMRSMGRKTDAREKAPGWNSDFSRLAFAEPDRLAVIAGRE